MARPPTIFKRSANLLLQHIASHVAVGDPLPTEQSMAELGEGSRTAIRSVLAHFHERGLISDLKDRRLLRKPVREDYFDLDEFIDTLPTWMDPASGVIKAIVEV